MVLGIFVRLLAFAALQCLGTIFGRVEKFKTNPRQSQLIRAELLSNLSLSELIRMSAPSLDSSLMGRVPHTARGLSYCATPCTGFLQQQREIGMCGERHHRRVIGSQYGAQARIAVVDKDLQM